MFKKTLITLYVGSNSSTYASVQWYNAGLVIERSPGGYIFFVYLFFVLFCFVFVLFSGQSDKKAESKGIHMLLDYMSSLKMLGF